MTFAIITILINNLYAYSLISLSSTPIPGLSLRHSNSRHSVTADTSRPRPTDELSDEYN